MDATWIRQQLEQNPEKTQRGLAAVLGLDPSAVNRLLKGERQIKAAEVPKIEAYFNAVPVVTDIGQWRTGEWMKVLGMAEGGKDGLFEWNGEEVDRVPRPPFLLGATDAYALYVAGESMLPRYRPGELLYVHAKRQPAVSDCGVFQIRTGDEEPIRALVKELVRRTSSKITLRQYNPPKEIEIPANTVIAQHRIVGSAS